MERKVTFSITGAAVLIVLAIVIAIYFIPSITTTDLSLDAVKLDKDGNQIGTVNITMQVQELNYLLQEDRIALNITPFDGLTSFIYEQSAIGEGDVPKHLFGDVWRLFMGAYDTRQNAMTFLGVHFTEDFDSFAIHTGDVCYVASVSGDRTLQELRELFGGIVPGL